MNWTDTWKGLQRLVLHERVLVFRHQLATSPTGFGPGGVTIAPMDPATIDRLFAAEPPLAIRFKRLLAAGHLGVVAHEEGRWLSYGWMTTPAGPQPPHLPDWSRGYFWIFYLHTHSDFRGRGLMKGCVQALMARAWEHANGSSPVLMADTGTLNVPSRSAFLRMGFAPAGEAELVRVPRLALNLGTWRTLVPHPAFGR